MTALWRDTSILRKKVFLNIWWISQENTCVRFSFLIKLQAFKPAILLNEDSNTRVSCEICKICKNTYFEVHLRTSASKDITDALLEFYLRANFLLDAFQRLILGNSSCYILWCWRKNESCFNWGLIVEGTNFLIVFIHLKWWQMKGICLQWILAAQISKQEFTMGSLKCKLQIQRRFIIFF